MWWLMWAPTRPAQPSRRCAADGARLLRLALVAGVGMSCRRGRCGAV